MTQQSLGDIDPNTTSGTELAVLLSAFGAAVESGHFGGTRPAYVREGMTWVRSDTSNQLSWLFYDGDTDITIGIVNKSANTLTLVTPPVTLEGLGGVPTSRAVTGSMSIAGGGSLASDRALALVNDEASPGAGRYYGTGSAGTKGFFLLPVPPKAEPHFATYDTPGTHSLTVPAGVTRMIAWVYGAAGGNFEAGDASNAPGGAGGCAIVAFYTTPGASISIVVGAAGEHGSFVPAGSGGGSGVPGVYCPGGGGADAYTPGVDGAPYSDEGVAARFHAPAMRTGSLLIGERGSETNGLVILMWWT